MGLIFHQLFVTVSYKAFYQTFYQNEQLFRRADEALTFPPFALETATVTDVVTAPETPDAPVIVDPVLPTAQPAARPMVPATVSEPEQSTEPARPAAVDDAPVAVAPAVPVMADAEQPLTQAAPPVVAPAPRRPAAPLLSQKVLILVDEDLQPSDLLFLEKILKAVNLDIAGVDLLNIHGTKNIDFTEVLAGKYIHHFFTFGVPFTRLHLDILMDRYQPVRFDGITFLMADPLPAIEADVVLKKKLWEALKKVFLWR